MEFKILNPCHRTWASLEGTGNERYCDNCKLGVHDLSQLTDHQLQEMTRGGIRLCVMDSSPARRSILAAAVVLLTSVKLAAQ